MEEVTVEQLIRDVDAEVEVEAGAEATVSGEPSMRDRLVRLMDTKIKKPFNASKVFHLISQGVEFLRDVKELTDEEKRDLVVDAVKEAVTRSAKLSNDQKDRVLLVVECMGDAVAEQVVELADDLQTFAVQQVKSLFSCICKKKAVKKGASGVKRALKGATGDSERNALITYLDVRMQRPFTESKLVSIVTSGVKFMQQFQGVVSGSERKDIVIGAVRHLLQHSDKLEGGGADAITRDSAIELLDAVADDLVNVFVSEGRKGLAC